MKDSKNMKDELSENFNENHPEEGDDEMVDEEGEPDVAEEADPLAENFKSGSGNQHPQRLLSQRPINTR